MSKSFFVIVSLITSLIIFFFASQESTPPFKCINIDDCVTIPPGNPIKIGIIQALSGGASTFGIEQLQSIELALETRKNQLLGHPVVLYVEDEKCSLEGGTNAALKLASMPQMLAIIGTTCSGSAVSAAKIVSEAGLVMISGSNIAPSLTTLGGKRGANWNSGYFRTIYNGSIIGKIAALFAYQELNIKKAAIINDGSAYTMDLTNSFKDTFIELNGEIVLKGSINKGDTNMVPILTAVSNSNAEFVFFPIYRPEADFIIKQKKYIFELKHVIFMTASALMLDEFINSIGKDGTGIYFISSAPPDTTANDRLLEQYKLKYKKNAATVNISYAYDAANMILNAIEAVAITHEDGTLSIGRQSLRDMLYNTIEVKGVTGLISCNEFGDCGNVNVNIMRLDNPQAGLKGLKLNIIKPYTSK